MKIHLFLENSIKNFKINSILWIMNSFQTDLKMSNTENNSKIPQGSFLEDDKKRIVDKVFH